MRRVLDALLPGGALWSPAENGDLDLLLDGIASNHESVREMLATVGVLRNPAQTTMLSDLEREYGILPNLTMSESARRARLAVAKSGANSDGSAQALQTALRGAGFDVYVYENDPVADPRTIVGELVVNGDTYEHSYYGAITTGDVDAVCGYGAAVCGDQAGFDQRPIVYDLPAVGGYWPLVFFIGGEVTRGAGGEVTGVAQALVPASRRAELISMIVRYKPMHTWCVLCVDLVDDDGLVVITFNNGSPAQFNNNTAILGEVL